MIERREKEEKDRGEKERKGEEERKEGRKEGKSYILSVEELENVID